jgi:hypothetical protein
MMLFGACTLGKSGRIRQCFEPSEQINRRTKVFVPRVNPIPSHPTRPEPGDKDTPPVGRLTVKATMFLDVNGHANLPKCFD